MQENVEGIEVVYNLVFEDALKKSDPELAGIIYERIERLEGLVKVKDIKSLDQKAVHVAGEDLAVLLQSAAPGLKRTAADLKRAEPWVAVQSGGAGCAFQGVESACGPDEIAGFLMRGW